MIEVGDHVIYGTDESDFKSRVIAIEDEWVWCRPLFDGGEPFTARLSKIKVVDREST